MRNLMPFAGAVLAAFLVQASSAQALTMKECSAKYNAAKSAGTLKGMNWNAFRKSECGSGAQATNAAPNAANTANTAANNPANNPAPNASRSSSRNVINSAAAPAAHGGNAVFPTRVAAKYANESAGKARRQTCLDQYNANKASGANGGLKWTEKGGGYYSECNNRLKGAG
jgi:hypothetical protein